MTFAKGFSHLHYDEDDTAEVDGGLQGGDSLRWERSPMILGLAVNAGHFPDSKPKLQARSRTFQT